jgi:FAD/FMN-containing dehydrogenase
LLRVEHAGPAAEAVDVRTSRPAGVPAPGTGTACAGQHVDTRSRDYSRSRFSLAGAAKAALDPAGIMNPGVLLPE